VEEGTPNPKWPLTASQVVLGAWSLGVRDPARVEELARRYASLPGPNLYTVETVRRLAVDMPRQGVSLERLGPHERAMAERVAELLRPLLDGAEDD